MGGGPEMSGHRSRTTARPGQIPQLVDVEELAHLLGVDVTTVWNWRKRGVLPPAVVIGRVVMWSVSDLSDWLNEQKEGN